MSADVEDIFVVVEAEVIALGDGLFDADKLRRFACGGIAQLHPLADGDGLTIADVENVILWVFFEQYFDEAAQVGDVEELELHFAVLREIEGSVEHGAVENKGFAVEVLVESVEVRRAQDVGLRDMFSQELFSAQFVHAVVTPDRVLAAGLIFGEGLRIRLGINGAGADEDVVVESYARSDQRADVLLGVGGGIEDGVEMPAAQGIAELCAVARNQLNAVCLRTAAAVEDGHLMPRFDKILRREAADKGRAACDKNFHILLLFCQ